MVIVQQLIAGRSSNCGVAVISYDSSSTICYPKIRAMKWIEMFLHTIAVFFDGPCESKIAWRYESFLEEKRIRSDAG